MRNKFDEQLKSLNDALTRMGSLCENAIAMSTRAVLEGNPKLSEEVIELSEKIDRKEREIETMCLKLILQQQPVAKDLRIISSALKMVTDMERIGDQAADIAEIISTSGTVVPDDFLKIHDMAVGVIYMVTESIEAFINKDVATAKKVIAYDDTVDDCFNQIKDALIELFKSPDADGEAVLDLLMIAKYFERIGDHAVNIAKWVRFSITGKR